MLQDVLAIVGGIGLLVTSASGLVAMVRSLKRGPKEDRGLEVDIQNRVTNMAHQWLEEADERLKELRQEVVVAREEAALARQEASTATSKVTLLETKLMEALEAIDLLWAWGQNGQVTPAPQLADWIIERLRKDAKGS